VTGLVSRARTLLRSNAAIYLLGSILSRVGAIVLIPLYTRRLTPDEYGEYSLAASGLQLLPMVASLGLTAGISRAYFGTEDRVEGARAMGAVARGMMLVVVAILGSLALLVRALAPDVLFGVQRHHWLLVIATAGGAALFAVPDVFFRASQQPRKAVTLQLSSFFLSAGLGVFFVLHLGRGLTGALEAAMVAWLAVGAFGAYFSLVRLPSGDVAGETRKALAVSIAFVPHHVASWLQLTADRWVLSAFGAAASLGAYYLAVQLLSPMSMVTVAFNDAEAPRMGELYRSGGPEAAWAAMRRMYKRYVLVTLAPGAAILLGSPLLPFLVGSKFLSAIAVLPLLGLAYVIDATYYPPSNFLFFVGRTGLIPAVTVTSSVLGLGLAILLLPRFGLTGLLVSRVATSVIRSAAMGAAAFIARPRHASAPVTTPGSSQ
jgi:O-antigen/teichoic acid export membrane protein